MNPDDPGIAPYSPPAQQVMTVSALNLAVAKMLERQFPLMWIAGEVSNFTRAASGHWYFTLKDSSAQVRAVMFRGRAQYAGFTPANGDKVEVRAVVTLYPARGDFQLGVEAIRRAGVGNLHEAFLRLKEKLQAEGLFDAERKRALPGFPKTMGIVTSPQAAALRDVLTTLRRRAPHVHLILYPTPVQGEGTGQKIAEALIRAGSRAECDVLILCRGGGSIEDLWSFNEEAVARAVAACPIPVISGVGHETDFTIADFAADLRAPTPTAAAEMAATAREDWLAALEELADDLTLGFKRMINGRAQELDWLARRLQSPAAAIAHERTRLAGLQARLGYAMRTPLAAARHALDRQAARLQAQLPDTRPQRLMLQDAARRMRASITRDCRTQAHALASLHAQLELLNPQRTLERGYAIVTDGQGTILRNPKQLQPRRALTVRLAEGSAQVSLATVQTTLE
ncbi:MAG: exodeoxyribonuclease VII large subunit [Burkholderiaceae bacterium]|nr:exodeoxyribonuclease VII large subunit [Burkholderiaceae bacterium]